MTIRLSVEFITQVPFLKNILAECPERTIAREDILYGMAQNLARINIQAVNQPKTNISLEDGSIEEGIPPGYLSPSQDSHQGCPSILEMFRRPGTHQGCP